ncbi:MAG: peptidyl-prolyl cis-trans isomerase C [Kiritimatiellia bacterium]|jgi:peptidyl-prolyl cis-trans isomerase C
MEEAPANIPAFSVRRKWTSGVQPPAMSDEKQPEDVPTTETTASAEDTPVEETVEETVPTTSPLDKPQRILVNGEEVPHAFISQELQTLYQRYQQSLPPAEFAQKQETIFQDAEDNAIERLLLNQAAKGQGEKVSEKEIVARFNKLKREAGGPQKFYKAYGLSATDDPFIHERLADDLQYEKYLDMLCSEVPEPDEAACQEFYEQNEASFLEHEQIRASHILLSADQHSDAASIFEQMLNIRSEIEDGADFEEVAGRYGCPQDAGDLGWVSRGQMVPDFEKAVFALKPGEVSDVVQTQFGYHVIKAFEHKESRVQPFEDVHEELRLMIWNKGKNDRIGEAVDALKAKAEITREDIVDDEPAAEPAAE